MNLLILAMSPGAHYTDDNDNDADDTGQWWWCHRQLHIMSWPLDQISQKQQPGTFIHRAIAIYVQATNMPFKYHIYATSAKYWMCIEEICQ